MYVWEASSKGIHKVGRGSLQSQHNYTYVSPILSRNIFVYILDTYVSIHNLCILIGHWCGSVLSAR